MTVILTVHGKRAKAPTLAEAARELKVSIGCLDEDYGVHLIDPRESLYIVRSHDPSLAEREGAYADVLIGTFG